MLIRDDEMTFGDRRLRVTLFSTDTLPRLENISTAHCLGFDDCGRFLLTHHVDRNWTIPGGHRDGSELAEEAMRRETIEEAAAIVDDPIVVAVERIDLLEGDRDQRYPDPSFQVFFAARVVRLDPLLPNDECLESRLFAVDEARQLPGWMDHNADLFDAALVVARARWGRRHGW